MSEGAVDIVGMDRVLRKLYATELVFRGANIEKMLTIAATPTESVAQEAAPVGPSHGGGQEGDLRDSIHIEPMGFMGDGAMVRVVTSLIYACQREFGGYIAPKTPGGMLHWVDESGEDHFANYVYQSAQPYMRPAFDFAAGTFENFLAGVTASELAVALA